MRIFGAIFWAVLLIVIGVVIILNQVFDWNISVFTIVIGVVFVFLGISIITGPSRSSQGTIFAGGVSRPVKSGDNNYIFSSAEISLDDASYDNIEINSVFSGVTLHTNGKSVKIKATGVFSQTVFPDNSALSFGDRVYERDGDDTIYIQTNCVFGSLHID